MKSVQKTATRMAAGALALGVSVGAHAGLMRLGTADVTFAKPIFQSGSDTATIFYPNRNGREGSMTVRAGRFSGSAVANGFDGSIFYESADLVHLYCVDLYQSIWSGAKVTYDVHTLDSKGKNILRDKRHPKRDFDRTLQFLGALNYTLATDYAKLGFSKSNYNWLNPSAGWMSGAIQLGIWESLYEDVGKKGISWDIYDGDFRIASKGKSRNLISDAGSRLLSSTFANIGSRGVSALDSKYALVLTNDKRQDMIVGDPPTDVPAPATLGLFATGIGLLLRRRRKA